MIHANRVYVETNGIYCTQCKKWVSRSMILKKLRSHPVASCTNCKTELYKTIVGEKTNERIAAEKDSRRTSMYIN